jgi:hypothetical protein
MSGGGFLSRLLGSDADEDDSSTYSAEETGTRRSWRRGELEEEQPPRGVSIQRIAETIAELPSSVPREHAVLIVRRTLAAADIKLSELDASTRAQESKLSSEIELARKQQKEVQEKTTETVRSLEEELRRTREARDGVIAYEEEKISRALATLKEVRRVRAFFDLPETEGEENTARIDHQGAQVLEAFDVGRTPLVRGRSEPLGSTDNRTPYGSGEGSSKYGTTSCDTSDE